MRVPIVCPECVSRTFEVVLIDGERLVLHCFTCDRERHVTTTSVKLEVA